MASFSHIKETKKRSDEMEKDGDIAAVAGCCCCCMLLLLPLACSCADCRCFCLEYMLPSLFHFAQPGIATVVPISVLSHLFSFCSENGELRASDKKDKLPGERH